MAKKTVDKKKKSSKKKPGPDPETLHKTDPQEFMEGPISSFMQRTKEIAEKNDEQSKEDATRKRDEKM